MKFTKMHGLGNDYLYVYSLNEPKTPGELSKKLSPRRFAVGADGMIWILPSKKADFKMRIFNADGSEAEMCGNGIRCVGKYVYEKGYTDKTELSIETLAGIKTLKLNLNGGKVDSVSVNMGAAEAKEEKTIEVLQQKITCTPVCMGNPHAVIFTSNAENAPLSTIGQAIEKHKEFPGGVNVEFVEKIAKNTLRMRVWERGSGITFACGTGACASAYAAVKRGICKRNAEIDVVLDGGILKITVNDDDTVIMEGGAEFVYEGEVL